MRGLWLEDRRLRVRDDLPVPEPPPGEARIRVTLAGLCHTDLELVRGYYPYTGVLGHEFVGVVDCAPSDAGLGRPARRRRDQRDLRRPARPAWPAAPATASGGRCSGSSTATAPSPST